MASKASPPNDTIVTRFKSAQLRRLRPMDRSMTSLTKLLKSPERSKRVDSMKKSSKRAGSMKGQKQLPKNSSIKSGPANSKLDKVDSTLEYYPNKLKRHMLNKKIVLKSRNNMKIVATTNKRKLRTPHKGLGSPFPSPKKTLEISSPEQSIVDMIRVFEETHDLDDEDLMEILTCPSPVWWEDPPDSTYIEDPICKRALAEMKPESKENQPQSKETPEDQTNLNVNLQAKDTNFKIKRSKLEGLLNNLKEKVHTEEVNINNKHFDWTADAIDDMKKLNIEQSQATLTTPKENHHSVLDAKHSRSIKHRKAKRRTVTIEIRNNKLKGKDNKSNDNMVNYTGKIQIKSCNKINREAQERLMRRKLNDTEKDKQDKLSGINVTLPNSKEEVQQDEHKDLDEKDKGEGVHLKSNADIKDVDDNVLSDNTDLSEISINEEFLKDLENINIPIDDHSVKNDKDVESNTTNDDFYNSKHNGNTNHKIDKHEEEDVFDIEKNEIDNKNPTNAHEMEEEYKNATSSCKDDEEGFDSYEFDLEFENAILGLENTVLQSGKVKKRNTKSKLNTKTDLKKDLKVSKDIKIETNNKTSPDCSIKTESVTSKQVYGKRKKEKAIKNAKNDSGKSESTVFSDTKVIKREDISQRGRIRRRKTPFDHKTGRNCFVSVKEKISNDSNIESPHLLTEPSEDIPQKTIKPKQAQSVVDIKKEIFPKAEVEDESIKTTESHIEEINDISKRGRIRRKKVFFNYEQRVLRTKSKRTVVKSKNINKVNAKETYEVIFPKKKYIPNHNKECNPALHTDNRRLKLENIPEEERSDIVDYVLKDLKKKYDNKILKSEIHNRNPNLTKKFIKQYVNTKNKPKYTMPKSRKSTQINDNDVNKGSASGSGTEIRAGLDKPFKDNNPVDDKKETFLSVFKKYGKTQFLDDVKIDPVPRMPKLKRCRMNIDSISDSCVTFIDESNMETVVSKRLKSKHDKSSSDTLDNEVLKMAEVVTDLTDNELNMVQNLGPNYKNVSPKHEGGDSSPEKQNEQIVLNTESKKLVTVQSDTEILNSSDDLETITVFKIIPKEIE